MRPTKEDLAPVEELNRLIGEAKLSSDSVMITDTTGIILFVNTIFEDTTGYSFDEAVGQHARFIKPDFHNQGLHRTMWDTLLTGNDFRAIFTNLRKNGEIFHEETHIRPSIDDLGVTTHFVATGRSLSEPLQAMLLLLQREASYDALTGLPNRSLFLDRLNQSFSHAARHSKKLSLLFIDLDNFKWINDTYGHAAGDAVLRTTASSLTASIRDEDTAARIGGDEFALILLDTYQRKDIELVSGKILAALAHGARFEDLNIPIRASVGASIYPDDGSDGDALMRQADSAMYMAKSAGGHCLRFFEKKDESTRDGR